MPFIAFPKQLRYTQILFTKVSNFENVPHQIRNRYISFRTCHQVLFIYISSNQGHIIQPETSIALFTK
ncbi:hypothetical protein [Nostoc sp.]|uniref:hypothetical protein n=1 Tax=Nostoc sp. TaxID=1180 RepID=UPI002FF97737